MSAPVAPNLTWHLGEVSRDERARARGHRGAAIWLTGFSGSGKSTIAHRVERRLIERGVFAYVLDGDNVRHGLCSDLGFSPAERGENVRRVGEVARLFVDAGAIVLAAFVSPYRADRARVRSGFGEGEFLEVHVATPLAVCAARDPKQLYARAERAEIADLSGVGSPYEPPLAPELVVDTTDLSVDACAEALLAELARRGLVPAP